MKLDDLEFFYSCCGWEGGYAEAKTKDGGIVRVKKEHDGTLYMMVFDSENKATKVDADGVPVYTKATQEQIEQILI